MINKPLNELNTKEVQILIRDLINRNQRLSILLANFIICDSCGIVDRDRNRLRAGYKCTNCGKEETATLYFDINVLSLIDLIQEFYSTELIFKEEAFDNEQRDINIRLAVVIFFCSLTEVLLYHFLDRLMLKLGISEKDRESRLNNNLSISQRVNKLFPSLTDDKWEKAINEINENVELDYNKTSIFCRDAKIARNEFLHKGNKRAIPKDMPEECITHIWTLLNLFVSLNNKYIAT